MARDTIGIRALADELNVRVQLIKDLIHAGHLKALGNRVTKESADELRWHLAMNKTLLGKDDEEDR